MLAALIVCTTHWRSMFFPGFNLLHSNRIPLLPFYLVTVGGHQAVIVFFVLSGLLVGQVVLRDVENGTWSWKNYLTHRMVRLWLVLLPALLLGLFWDRLGLAMQHAYPWYSGNYLRLMYPPDLIVRHLSLSTFLANCAFLQKIIRPEFGTNSPLWSLSNEFWYYILFPCCVLALHRKTRPVARVAYGLAAVAIAIFVGHVIASYFLVWLGGVVLLKLPLHQFGRMQRLAATVVYFAMFTACAPLSKQFGGPADALLAILTVAYVWMLYGTREQAKETHASVLARQGARFSYTLYLVHFPLLYFIAGFFIHQTQLVPNVRNLTSAFLVLLPTLIYAWLVAMATEFNLIPVRDWVKTRLDHIPT
ncbi:MAG: acyltransferase [Acidobacteriota bacterium]|nr:acyltransferase [Acidobacteriota bacterium]